MISPGTVVLACLVACLRAVNATGVMCLDMRDARGPLDFGGEETGGYGTDDDLKEGRGLDEDLMREATPVEPAPGDKEVFPFNEYIVSDNCDRRTNGEGGSRSLKQAALDVTEICADSPFRRTRRKEVCKLWVTDGVGWGQGTATIVGRNTLFTVSHAFSSGGPSNTWAVGGIVMCGRKGNLSLQQIIDRKVQPTATITEFHTNGGWLAIDPMDFRKAYYDAGFVVVDADLPVPQGLNVQTDNGPGPTGTRTVESFGYPAADYAAPIGDGSCAAAGVNGRLVLTTSELSDLNDMFSNPRTTAGVHQGGLARVSACPGSSGSAVVLEDSVVGVLANGVWSDGVECGNGFAVIRGSGSATRGWGDNGGIFWEAYRPILGPDGLA